MRISLDKVNITPLQPTYIGGHSMRTGKMQGVHDEIEMLISWLTIEEKKILFVVADLSNFDYVFVHEAKRRIMDLVDVEYDNIILGATHTHSGPVINTRQKNQPHDETYRQYVMEQLLVGVERSYDKGQEVARVTCRVGESYGYYGNRNSQDKYGDQFIYVLEFKDENDQNIAAFVNISVHSTVLSPVEYLISGDLIGAIRRKLIPVLGVEPLVTGGNAGDMSTRLYRKGNDFSELDRVSQGIVDQIIEFEPPFDISLDNFKSKSFRFNVIHKPDMEELKSKMEESKRKLEETTEFDDRKWLISQISNYKRKLKVPVVNLDYETTVLRTDDLEIVVAPCEIVANFGKQIKKSSSAKVCIIWGYANGTAGYVVEASEFESGHDGISTNLPKGKAEEYIAKIIQNLY